MNAVLDVCSATLAVSFALALTRLFRGPTTSDRVLALDLMAVLSVGMVSIFAIRFDQPALLDVALAVALVTFLATIAFSGYIERSRCRE